MLISHTTVAVAIIVTSQLKKNLNIKLQESVGITESFSASYYIHQKALRYYANTIVAYPKLLTQLLM